LDRAGWGLVPHQQRPNMLLLISSHHTTLSTLIFCLIRSQKTNSYEQVLGKPPKVGPGFFVGDANYLFEKGQKCIYFGPGNADCGVHGTNEYYRLSTSSVPPRSMLRWP
jgi:hypothetical protein